MEASLGRPSATPISAGELMRQVNITKRYIPRGRYGRRYNISMDPRYITIHSTQNYSGDAWRHALALQRGKLRGGKYGYMCWHFTVQEDVVLQHLPTNKRGEHADYDGPGNKYSIGVEMCEHRGNSRERTVERTAMLTASLMRTYDIPLKNVVPHYHWPRPGTSKPHKNCPHFLLDNGRPGRTWQWFLGRVKLHYDRTEPPRRPSWRRRRDRGSRGSMQPRNGLRDGYGPDVRDEFAGSVRGASLTNASLPGSHRFELRDGFFCPALVCGGGGRGGVEDGRDLRVLGKDALEAFLGEGTDANAELGLEDGDDLAEVASQAALRGSFSAA